MRCPYCHTNDTKVIDKRDNEGTIKRRRECLKCKKRFTTYEKVEELNLRVIKKDGRREPYSREKLMGGLQKACEKLPIPQEKIEKAADQIEAKVKSLGKKEVPTKYIGELSIKKLKTLNKVAYMRFASIYKEFVDISEFQKEMKKLLQK